MEQIQDLIDLTEVEPELRDPVPRPMRWKFTLGAGHPDLEKNIVNLLQHGTVTRARILQCEWFDDGQSYEVGPSIRARYQYRDRHNREYIETFERSYDGMHLYAPPFDHARVLERTWHVGGWVTVLYNDANPVNSSRIYNEMYIKLVSPAPPKKLCPCCGHQTLETEVFVKCPTCGHHTLQSSNSEKVCRVCRWICEGNNRLELAEAKRNYQLFGAYDELALKSGQNQPYPEEIIGKRFTPPRIWFVGFSSSAYWDGIWKALVPFHYQFEQGWQILIAQHDIPKSDRSRFWTAYKDEQIAWWKMYNSEEIGFIQWQQGMREAFMPLEPAPGSIRGLCDAIFQDLTPQVLVLDTSKLLKWQIVADWSYCCLIVSDQHILEFRLGQAKKPQANSY